MISVKNIEKQRINFLDFLRGIAILLVFLSHIHHLINIEFLHQFGSLFSRGVQLFYMVSGFTIFMIYYDKLNNKIELKKYFLKRFFRIMPLLYILLPIYYILFGLGLKYESSLPEWYHFISHYLLLFGFHQDTMVSIIAPAWSIFDEFLFYIIIGLLLIHFDIKNYIVKIITGLFLVSFITFIYGNIFYSDDIYFKTYLFFSPLTQLFIFFIGGSIFLISKKFYINKIFFMISILILLIYSIFLNSTTLSLYLTVILFSIIILYLSQNSFNYNRFFLLLGRISFSFYLIHMIIIKIFEENNLFNISSNKAIVLIFIITFLVSFLSFKYIEQFFIDYGKKVIYLK